MEELDMKQITDKLNIEITGESRKPVFWYDDNGDFSDEIEISAREWWQIALVSLSKNRDEDVENDTEAFRQEVVMDIVSGSGF